MIVANLSSKGEYIGLHPELDKALELLTPEFLKEASTERTLLDGENLFVTKFHLETVPEEQTFFEAHRKYLDIQVVTEGAERVEIAHPDTLTLTEHRDDFYGYTGQGEQSVILKPGNFLIVFPGDAHRLKMPVKKTGEPFTRVVFKVRIAE
jgi:biofilm protein TabA